MWNEQHSEMSEREGFRPGPRDWRTKQEGTSKPCPPGEEVWGQRQSCACPAGQWWGKEQTELWKENRVPKSWHYPKRMTKVFYLPTSLTAHAFKRMDLGTSVQQESLSPEIKPKLHGYQQHRETKQSSTRWIIITQPAFWGGSLF